MAVLTNMNLTSQSQVHLARSLERILEEAHLSGELNLSGRKLKDFPNSGGKYDLSDSVIVDLSKNRFIELPLEVTNFWSLERLSCHHNNIKSIPDSVLFLQSLIYLDLSRNQLTSLPPALCDLPLQSLLVSHNKLTALPGELVRCSSLTELNVSCNQITHLPPSLGQLGSLRSLNARNNLLLELPIELTYLRLTHLDLSCNRLASLPLEFRNMNSLIDLDLNHNPLVSPPTTICMRGRVHVFKWLELRSSQGPDASRKVVRKLSEVNKYRGSRQGLAGVNSDSGYSTGLEWQATPPTGYSQTLSAQPSTNHLNRSDEGLNGSYKKRMERSSSEREVNYKGLNSSSSVDVGKNGAGLTNGNAVNGEDLIHKQTYREYKEALKQQRSQENVYKRGNSSASNSSESSPSPSGSCSVLTPPQVPPTLNSSSVTTPIIKPVQMVQPSRPVSHQSTPTEHNGHDHRDSAYNKPTTDHPPPYIKPSGPPPLTPMNGRPPLQSSWSPAPLSTPPDKLNFTMRREYDRAKEEANLVNQLRQNIETRLKMSLPAELGPALSDGVVLCHLANHVRPRSVASIHVPSPAVPKLTMARCRRNVDNFLEACRKIGMEEGDLCDRDSIVTLTRGSLCTLSNTVTRLLAREYPVDPEPEIREDPIYPEPDREPTSYPDSDSRNQSVYVEPDGRERPVDEPESGGDKVDSDLEKLSPQDTGLRAKEANGKPCIGLITKEANGKTCYQNSSGNTSRIKQKTTDFKLNDSNFASVKTFFESQSSASGALGMKSGGMERAATANKGGSKINSAELTKSRPVDESGQSTLLCLGGLLMALLVLYLFPLPS